MFNQKGQIQIVILVLVVVGFILYLNFSGSDIISKWFGSYKITPHTETSGKISAPSSVAAPAPVITAPVILTPSVSAPPDNAPPMRLNPRPIGNLPPETRRINLSLETDEKAICRHSDTAGLGYDSMQGDFDQTNGVLHSVLITTLGEGQGYVYYIKCTDEKGNKNPSDFVISFAVSAPEDKTPPVLTNPSHQEDILPKDTREAVISISTSEPASCRYSANAGMPYNSMPGSFSQYDQTKRFHTKTITSLQNGKMYDFFVRCQDSAGNSNTGDVLISFTVSNL